MALALVALGMVRHVLRSRRFYEGLAVAAIALGSMRGISQESRASAMARLAAWNKREIQRLEHKAEHLEHKVERRPARLRAPPLTATAVKATSHQPGLFLPARMA